MEAELSSDIVGVPRINMSEASITPWFADTWTKEFSFWLKKLEVDFCYLQLFSLIKKGVPNKPCSLVTADM